MINIKIGNFTDRTEMIALESSEKCGWVSFGKFFSTATAALKRQRTNGGSRMKAFERLKKEIKEIGLVTLYFLIGFGFIFLLKKLFLAEYSLAFYGFTKAAIAALVVAKVVVILDETHLVDRLRRFPRCVSVFYKTTVYTLGVFLVMSCEKLFHAYREKGAISSATEALIKSRDMHHVLAATICVALLLVGYSVIVEINRAMGEGALFRLFFRQPK